MRSARGCAVLALTLMAAAPAFAQYGGGAPGAPAAGGFGGFGGYGGGLGVRGGYEVAPRFTPDAATLAQVNQLNRLQTDLQIQQQLYREKIKALDALRSQYAPGHVKVKQAEEQLDRTKLELEKLYQQMEALQKEILERQRSAQARIDAMLAPFNKPVAVDLRDATIRQAAEALSRVAGMEIVVDEAVPDTTRLKVQAKGVALGAILEAIAAPAGLELTPTAKGVRVTTWPMLKVNEDITVFTGPNAPWAEEFIQKWGFRPAFGAGGARAWQGYSGGGYPGPGYPATAPGGGPTGPGGSVGPQGVLTAPMPVPNGPVLTAPAATPPSPETTVLPAPGNAEPVLPPVNPGDAQEPIALAALGNRMVVTLEEANGTEHPNPRLVVYYYRNGLFREVSETQHQSQRTIRLTQPVGALKPGAYDVPGAGYWWLSPADPDSVAVMERYKLPAGAVVVRTRYELEDGRMRKAETTVLDAAAVKAPPPANPAASGARGAVPVRKPAPKQR